MKKYRVLSTDLSYLVGRVVRVMESEFTDVPYLVDRVVCVIENSELSLLMLHIWLVGSFVSN